MAGPSHAAADRSPPSGRADDSGCVLPRFGAVNDRFCGGSTAMTINLSWTWHHIRSVGCVSCLLITASTAMTGCLSVSTRFVSGLSAEQRAMAAELPVYDRAPSDSRYRVIGEVKGLSCQTSANSAYRASEGNARDELKRSAVREGANGLMNVSCSRLTRGQQGTNCFTAFQCQGTAILVGDTDTGSQ